MNVCNRGKWVETWPSKCLCAFDVYFLVDRVCIKYYGVVLISGRILLGILKSAKSSEIGSLRREKFQLRKECEFWKR